MIRLLILAVALAGCCRTPLSEEFCEQLGHKLARCEQQRGQANAQAQDCWRHLDQDKAGGRAHRWPGVGPAEEAE